MKIYIYGYKEENKEKIDLTKIKGTLSVPIEKQQTKYQQINKFDLIWFDIFIT